MAFARKLAYASLVATVALPMAGALTNYSPKQPPRRPNALRSYGILGDLLASFCDKMIFGLPGSHAVGQGVKGLDLDNTAGKQPASLAAALNAPAHAFAGAEAGFVDKLRSLPSVLLSSLATSFVDKKSAALTLQRFKERDGQGHAAYFGSAVGSAFNDDHQLAL